MPVHVEAVRVINVHKGRSDLAVVVWKDLDRVDIRAGVLDGPERDGVPVGSNGCVSDRVEKMAGVNRC